MDQVGEESLAPVRENDSPKKNGWLIAGLAGLSIAGLVILASSIISIILLLKKPAYEEKSIVDNGVDFPVVPYLGLRGTYLIALADPTTEAKFLPNIAPFVPAEDDLCDPGKQCIGMLKYDGTQESPPSTGMHIPASPNSFSGESSYSNTVVIIIIIIIIVVTVILFRLIGLEMWRIINLFENK